MIWHYTSSESFISIANDGLVLPTTLYVPAGERPIVWFSTEDFWEPTATKKCSLTGKMLTLDEMLKHEVLPVRIGVNPTVAPHRWSDLKLLSGINPDTARALASSGKQMGANPSRWRGTFEAVPAEKWEAVEYYNGLCWRSHEWKNRTSEVA